MCSAREGYWSAGKSLRKSAASAARSHGGVDREASHPEREAHDVAVQGVIRVVGQLGRKSRLPQGCQERLHVAQACGADPLHPEHEPARPRVTRKSVVGRDRDPADGGLPVGVLGRKLDLRAGRCRRCRPGGRPSWPRSGRATSLRRRARGASLRIVSDSIPPSSAMARAARRTRSLLKGGRGSGLESVWAIGLTTLRCIAYTYACTLTMYVRGRQTMQAIVYDEVRLTGCPRATGDRHAGGRGRSGAAQGARGVRQPARLAPHARRAVLHAHQRRRWPSRRTPDSGADVAGRVEAVGRNVTKRPARRRGLRRWACKRSPSTS